MLHTIPVHVVEWMELGSKQGCVKCHQWVYPGDGRYRILGPSHPDKYQAIHYVCKAALENAGWGVL